MSTASDPRLAPSVRRLLLMASALALLAAPSHACADGSEGEEDEALARTHAIMGGLLESLQVLLPASASPERIRNATDRPKLVAAAAALARNASALERHAVQIDDEAVFLGASLARDAHAIHESLERGQFERARYQIGHLTEACVSCHARLPSDDSPRAEAFVASATLAGLPLDERATLQIATRRFSDALGTLEAQLLASDVPPALLIGPLTDYLIVNLRVKRDFDRPVPVLARFAARPDLWRRLRLDVEVWVQAIPELKKSATAEAGIAEARELIAKAKRANQYPGDREGLVYYIAASGILYRLIESRPDSESELAEAYYLLAATEVYIERNYWVTPADFLLEYSIRMAPDSDFADDAYALLEQQILQSYEGMDEGPPEDDTARLDELRRLIDR